MDGLSLIVIRVDLFPYPLHQQFLTEGLCYFYSILIRCSAILSKFGKEIDFWKDICELLDKAINANTPLSRFCMYF